MQKQRTERDGGKTGSYWAKKERNGANGRKILEHMKTKKEQKQARKKKGRKIKT